MTKLSIKLRKVLLTILSVVIIAIFATSSMILHYSLLQTDTEEQLKRLELLSSQIVYLDEVLTTSARLGAYTGDVAWQERYDNHVDILDAALIEAIKLDPKVADAVYQTSKTNTKLVELELEAFDLIAQGQKARAIDILFGDKYLNLKNSYAQSMQRAMSTLKDKSELLHRQQSRKTHFFILVLAILTLVFLAAWLVLLIYIRKSDKIMHDLVITDQLTGLFNRRHFDDLLCLEINRYREMGGVVMLAIIDVDHFKTYNDTYGHPMGDQVLIAIGKVLKQVIVNNTGHAFRIGGEEFALLANVECLDHALRVLNEARELISQLNIKHEKTDGPQRLTISVGFTLLAGNRICETETLYHEADQALYDAKAQGRDHIIQHT